MKCLFFLSILFVFITVACTRSATAKQLAGTDSLVIRFNIPGTHAIAQTMSTTEESAISKLKQFVDAPVTRPSACDMDGNLMFYRKGVLAADISFTFAGDSCRYFVMDRNGELVTTKLGNEAADFLSSLRQGREWY